MIKAGNRQWAIGNGQSEPVTRYALRVTRSWTRDYIGLPFMPDGRDRAGIDCWGLVCLVYREQLDIELPSYSGVYTEASREALRIVAGQYQSWRQNWEPVDFPRALDVVLFRIGGLNAHVGIVIDRRHMLHILSGIDSCIEAYAGLIWRDRLQGFYRWTR